MKEKTRSRVALLVLSVICVGLSSLVVVLGISLATTWNEKQKETSSVQSLNEQIENYVAEINRLTEQNTQLMREKSELENQLAGQEADPSAEVVPTVTPLAQEEQPTERPTL